LPILTLISHPFWLSFLKFRR